MSNVDILIRGCVILPMNGRGIIENGLIAIRGDRLVYVGRAAKAPRMRAEKVVDGRGKIALPGLINGHTHLPMTLLRGVAEDQELSRWLSETIWPLEAKLTPNDIYVGALLGCLELIKSGTTCFVDMYFHEDQVARAVEESGLRAVLSPGILEVGDRERGERMLREAVQLAQRLHGSADGRIQVRLGPHTLYTCSPELLRRVGEEASRLGLGIHIHLAESREMADQIRRVYGMSEVELLGELGLLGLDVLAAHCIHLSERDIQLMAEHHVKAVYNPISNMKVATGIAKIHNLKEAGVTVCLGTDGPASNNSLDMFEEMKVAALLQKVSYMNPRVLPVRTVVELATIEGAKALGPVSYTHLTLPTTERV